MEAEAREVVEEQEVEEEEPEVEETEQQAMETSVPIPDHNYSTNVSSRQSTPLPIYFIIATTLPPPNLVPINDAMTDTLLYAMGIGPHPASLQ